MVNYLSRVWLKRRTHLTFGAGLAVAVSSLLGASSLSRFIALVFSLIGADIPDKDLRKGHRVTLHNIPVATVICILLGVTILLLTGSPALAIYASLGYFSGHVSHILLDALTVKGVALLYPFRRRMYRFAGFKSDSEAVNALITLIGGFLALLGLTFYDFSMHQ